ncbi:hypothetical protein AGMMS50293_02660 [Spirochaetia bacterium]|nr:hypothetical protein AGMMS50293_02660 [Spirochaetia bacterium]
MLKKIIYLFLLANTLLPCFISAQEALKSAEEEYYDFLALQGLTERPTLNYRTLSDSVWTVAGDAASPWQNQNLGQKFNFFDSKLTLKIYGPELFMSGNTAAPYGQNDGALWQGRGFNSILTGGARLEAYGIEATFRPQLAFSQNAEFEIMPSAYDSPYGYFWGYSFRNKNGDLAGVDAPQRFGDKPFFVFDWGDTEIRYTWKTLTVGFGTQTIWLGSAYLNPILHSNNAPSYPKFDIGLRKQPVTIPGLDWYIGDVEARLWVGYLTESGYYGNKPEKAHTMFHGLAFAYAPSFLPGLTLFANRVCLVDWKWENLKFVIPTGENDGEDQKGSFGLSWVFPQAGFEFFGELGIDDFVPDALGFFRYSWHTLVYTVGLKKSIKINPGKKIYGEIIFEWDNREMSQDFQLQWPYSFYFHSDVSRGYTNKGQWMGSGSGWGGNNQYLEFRLYYPKGMSSVFIHRNNPDNNFIYSKAVEASATADDLYDKYFMSWKANFIIGLDTFNFIMSQLAIGGGIAYNLIINPIYYENKSNNEQILWHNFSFKLVAKVLF